MLRSTSGDRAEHLEGDGASIPVAVAPAGFPTEATEVGSVNLFWPQVPTIDPLKCVACRACVDACPFDALDIVQGLAQLVSRPGCHGVESCVEACPTGAITMTLTEDPPDHAPLAPHFESLLRPGLFLVGDHSGLSLIKYAINTGVQSVDAIAARHRVHGCDTEVAIVGAGPAGLSAAIRCTEQGLRYVLLGQDTVASTIRHFPRSKLVFAQPFDVPLL